MGVDPSITVRRIEPAEEQLAPPVAALVNRAYAPAVLELWTVPFDRVSVEGVAGYIAARELVLAERGGTPVGRVRYRDQDEDTGWFGLLAADPGTAGSGVGRVLVEAVEAMARTAGHRWIELDLLIGSVATPHQSRLRDWYARRGYREIDRAAFRLSDDALAAALRWPCVSIRERKQLGPGE